MYLPTNNKVLVEIDVTEDKWGTGNDDSMLGKDYREGWVRHIGMVFTTKDYPIASGQIAEMLKPLEGRKVMWNQGHEAGTIFEDGNRKYALIYWYDIIGIEGEL